MPSIMTNSAVKTPSNPTGALTYAIRAALAISPLLLTPQIVEAQDVDLGNLGDRGFRIEGIDPGDNSGFSVSGAGDVNGDGFGDLIIGAPEVALGAYFGNSGESYVVFGRADNTTLNLSNLGAGGFVIEGNRGGNLSGASVSGAGDVNGDGLADLIVGARGADPDGNNNAGSSYVVFGKSDSSPVDLLNLDTGGFRIDGIDAGDLSGASVAGAGDVNGDGLSDLIVGAPYRYRGSLGLVGESYVIFGKANTSPVDLAQLGAGGFRIEGVNAGDSSGNSVSGAGDVNGDGLADLIVGARGADPVGTVSVGASYVVFGKVDNDAVELGDLGAGGFRILRTLDLNSNDSLGASVSGAGDVNGDGLSDLIVGANRTDTSGLYDAGQSFVVFGKSDSATVDLSLLGSQGFRIDGIEASARFGGSVSSAGDVNGDGLADLIIGARYAEPGESFSGQSYLLFGKSNSTPVDLANLGGGGFAINGAEGGDSSGKSVSGAGDVNGDGLADVIIGAPYGDAKGNDNEGHSYVLFSASTPLLNAAYRVRSGNGDPPRTAVGSNGDGSNSDLPDARFWVDFSDGEDLLSLASTEIVTLSRSAGSFPQPAAQVSWRFQTNRQKWTTAEVTVRYLESELIAADENALQLSFSPTGTAPFTPLLSQVNPQNKTILATISGPGYIYVGEGDIPDDLFGDRFEATSR